MSLLFKAMEVVIKRWQLRWYFKEDKLLYVMEPDLEESKEKQPKEYIQGLMDFGLSDEESKVYLSVLRRGSRGEIVGRIKDELEIGRTTIYAIMERLNEKGWVVSEMISQSPKRIKYVAKSPLKILIALLRKKRNN